MSEPAVLQAVLGDYPHTLALKTGALTSPEVTLAFTQVEPVHKAFSPMVRRAAYDLSELAVVTALEAFAFDRPVVLLPAVIASRLQRGCIIYDPRHGPADPLALADQPIGVRAYTQTTGMWVRAHLAEDYGLPIERMRWITRDPAHVQEYLDPPIVEHAATDKGLTDMLRDGDVKAAILGNDLPKDGEFAPVIPDHQAVDRAWYARHGFMPINHMVAVSAAAARGRPEAVRAAYRLIREADARTPTPEDGMRRTIFGFEALRGPMQTTIGTCARQMLIPGPIAFDDLFAEARAILGDDGG